MPASLTPWNSSDGELQEVERSPNGRYIRYNILLGKGACKRVYKALDTEEGLELAWNQVELLGMDRDEEARQHLQEEIRVLQQLKHKNIMTFYAWWYDKSNLHINFVTELFTAGNLRQYRKKLKFMSENVLKRWAHQILEGLLYLHGHTPPIVHRDLKCDNIFVNSATGEVKIGDLGLATVQQTAMSVVGTPEFMAPEVYDESYDERCDIYSFGMCLLELATLEYPYAECHSVPQIFKKVTLGVPPASLARVPPELRDFIAMCIAHDPADRPSARELLKHPFLEPVRLHPHLPTSDSFSALSCAGGSVGSVASAGLATMCTGGGGGGAGSGWSTPSGTLHCAASVRDLREALHQQEAAARHQHQQHQLLQQQLQQLHHSCPDAHSPAAAAAAAAADGGGGEILRCNTGPMITPPLLTLAVPLVRSPSAAVSGQASPLGGAGRSTRLSWVSPAGSQPPLPPGAAAPGHASPRDALPQLLTPSGASSSGGGGGGGAAPLVPSLRSMDSSEDSDADSDQEVLVNVEDLKEGMRAEGFVDLDAACFASEPSQTGSDPSALSLVDPALLAGGALLQPHPHPHLLPNPPELSQPPLHSQSDPLQQRQHQQQPHQLHRPSWLQPRQEQQEQQQQQQHVLQALARSQCRGRSRPGRGAVARPTGMLRSGDSSAACETIAEGEGGGSGSEESAATAAATGGEELDRELTEGDDVVSGNEGEHEEEEEEEARQGGGEDEAAVRGPEQPDAGPSVDLDPWAQRWALQGSLQAAMGLARGGAAGVTAAAATGGDAAPPSLACSVGSSASSTARLLFHASGGSGGSGNAGHHSRHGSADTVTFNPLAPPGVSGANTPALRSSYSGGDGEPPSPPQQHPTAAAAATALPPAPRGQLATFGSAGLLAASPPLATRGSTSALGGTPPAPNRVRLPSFRNKVLLIMQPAAAQGGGVAATAAAAAAGGSPPAVSYFRSTSARLCGGGGGGSRTRDPPNFSCPSVPAAGPIMCGFASAAAARRASAADVDAAAAYAASLPPFAAREAAAAAAAASLVPASLVGDDDAEVSEAATTSQSTSLPLLAAAHGGSGDGESGERALPPLPPQATAACDSGGASKAAGSGSGSDTPAEGTAKSPLVGRLSELADAVLTAAHQVSSALVALGDTVPAEETDGAAAGEGHHAAAAAGDGGGRAAVSRAASSPAAEAAEALGEDVTVIKEISRPIQGVIMRLKQWKRLMKDRAKGRRG